VDLRVAWTQFTHLSPNDVYFVAVGVKEVDLVVPDEMTAGVQQFLTCTSHGAYPTVKIEFWKMQKRLSPKLQMVSRK
jgi:hypothetical protein